MTNKKNSLFDDDIHTEWIICNRCVREECLSHSHNQWLLCKECRINLDCNSMVCSDDGTLIKTADQLYYNQYIYCASTTFSNGTLLKDEYVRANFALVR